MVSPLMAGFKDHPELFIQFLKSDPGFRNVLEKNPRMEEMLNDPTTIDYLLDMMSNPDSMRDALRQTDEALNHVGDIPGGEQMLERVMSVFLLLCVFCSNTTSPSTASTTRGATRRRSIPRWPPRRKTRCPISGARRLLPLPLPSPPGRDPTPSDCWDLWAPWAPWGLPMLRGLRMLRVLQVLQVLLGLRVLPVLRTLRARRALWVLWVLWALRASRGRAGSGRCR